MARRQHTLTSPISVDDALGAPVSYDLVQIRETVRNDPEKHVSYLWQCGRLNAGVWEQAGRHGDVAKYQGEAFDNLIGTDNTQSGTRTDEEIQDQVYQDLVTASRIGAGAQGDYDEDASSSSSAL